MKSRLIQFECLKSAFYCVGSAMKNIHCESFMGYASVAAPF